MVHRLGLYGFCFSSSLIFATACGGGGDQGTVAGSSSSVSSAAGGGSGATGSGGAGGGEVGCLDGQDGGIGGGGGLACDGAGARFVTDVLSACFGPGAPMPASLPGLVAGPPKGAGCCAGSLDVVSLGNGGSIIVGFHGNAIVDAEGPDFIVFENAFDVGNDPDKPYADLGTVSVSDDGATWSTFPCTATKYPYGSCAGWHPVNANADKNMIDPLDPAAAGGDAFDLADLGVKQARFVRITDRPDMPADFDLDAVAIVHARCP